MLKRLNVRHVFGVIALGTILIFQNCSDPTPSDQDSASSYTKDLPFAYKASLDTIAYMSCSRMAASYERRAFFTFRAGAYTPIGGLGLNTDFAEATKYYTLTQKKQAFNESAKNANTRLQLAIRGTSNFQTVLTSTGTPADGTSLGTMMTNLGGDAVASHLASMVPGDIKHYFPSAETNRLMASSLRFNEGNEADVAKRIRDRMDNREALLALTFTDTDSAMDAKARGSEGVSSTSAYGRGYQMVFGTPLNWATAERRIIQSVNEVELSTNLPSVSATWVCPTSMQFVMIRYEDIALVPSCARAVDSYTNATQQQALEVIRRVLPVEDFYVDVVNRCIVPKAHISSQSCYGNRSGLGAINYSSGSCSGDACPHYVSVCVKTQ